MATRLGAKTSVGSSRAWPTNDLTTGSGYTFLLVNPVSIAIFDEDGRMTDQVSAIRASTSGALSASDSLPQSSSPLAAKGGINEGKRTEEPTMPRTLIDEP
jgi:hypothetical protein